MSFNTGQWLDTEHKIFIEAVQIFGNNWRKLSLYVKTRSASQIRSHTQKFIKKVAMQKKIFMLNNNLENLQDKLNKVFPYRKDLYKTFMVFRNYIPKREKQMNISSENSFEEKFQKNHNFTLGKEIKNIIKIYDNQSLAVYLAESFSIYSDVKNMTKIKIALLSNQISEVNKNLHFIN